MRIRHSIVTTLALFGSCSTLVCCALPALFVSLGAGAALAGIVSNVPQLIWLSEHKVLIFSFAGMMLTISGTTRYLTRHAPCPAGPEKGRACMRLRRISLGVFLFSLGVYLIGFYFAFIAAHLA